MLETSLNITALAMSLSKAQGKIENAAKNTRNEHFKNRYSDLSEILNTIRPVFAEHGLSFVQVPSYDAGVAHVTTLLMHESGEWIKGTSSAPVSKQDAQGVGSATTYLRRYSLAAVSGIGQEDDDGNAATGAGQKGPIGATPVAKPKAEVPPKPDEPTFLNKAQVSDLENLLLKVVGGDDAAYLAAAEAILKHVGVQTWQEVPAARYKSIRANIVKRITDAGGQVEG